MTKHAGLCALLALCLCASAIPSFAQSENSDPRKAAFYRHVEEGVASMRVNVWGDVNEPGQYEVRAGTDLLELLFLAGGPNEGIERSNERRTTTILLSRQTDALWSIVFEAPLDDLTSFQQPYPALQNGDALRVDVKSKRTFGWRDAFTVVGALGTVALVLERITRLTDN